MSNLPVLPHPARHRMLLGLALGLVGMAAFLLMTDAPWQGLAAKTLKRGREFEVAEYVQVGLWWAGLGVAVLLGLLLVTFRWWWKWSERATLPVTSQPTQRRCEILGLVILLAVGGWLRVPLMDQGIKWDEHDNLRRNFHGLTMLDQAAKGDPWKPAGYREAFFENERSNNPFLYSVLAHASLDAWRMINGASRDRFNVVAMRIPALLAGMGGLLTAWLLARRVGGGWVGLLTLGLLAMHPLHVRYSVEARGYSLVLLLAPVFLLCGMSLLQRGTWRMAFATTFAAAGTLYAFPGAVYFVGMGGVGLVLGLWSQRDAAARATLVRLSIAGALALAMLVFLLAPALMQAAKTLDAQFQKTGMPLVWLVQTWDWMSVGVHVPGEQEYFDLRDGKVAWGEFFMRVVKAEFVLALVAWVLIPVLLVLGMRRLWRLGAVMRLVGIAGIGAPILCLLHHGLITHYGIFQWYMIYSLPVLALIVSLGLGEMLPKIMPIASAVFLVLFWFAANPHAYGNQRGYMRWQFDHGLPTARTLFHRGTKNTYETWADGRVLRLPLEKQPEPPTPP